MMRIKATKKNLVLISLSVIVIVVLIIYLFSNNIDRYDKYLKSFLKTITNQPYTITARAKQNNELMLSFADFTAAWEISFADSKQVDMLPKSFSSDILSYKQFIEKDEFLYQKKIFANQFGSSTFTLTDLYRGQYIYLDSNGNSSDFCTVSNSCQFFFFYAKGLGKLQISLYSF